MADPSLTFAQDPFLAPAGGWQRVSPRLATARRLLVLGPLAAATLVGVVAAVASDQPQWGLVALAAGAALGAWAWWLVGRQVRAVGYCLRTEDLLVVSGIMFRRLVVVPFGRMQLVDVTRGPVDRWLGLASVQLHTAAATTDASIPGLTPEAAAQLRDQLAGLGEQRSAGL